MTRPGPLSRRSLLAGLAALPTGAMVRPASAQAPAARPARIAMLGDSLTAGYGLQADQSLPAQLERALRAAGRPVTVANHGVSGDTTAGGLARLEWMLGDRPDIVIVALGANDALRGLDPAEPERNLDSIVATLKQRGVAVLLAGMFAPRNFGEEYVRAFDSIHPRLASKHGVALYPFLLDGVAQNPALNLPDGIHPNAAGVRTIVERFLPTVVATLDAWARGTNG